MRFKAWEIFSGINCDDNISSFESTVMILSAVRNHLGNHNPRVTAKVQYYDLSIVSLQSQDILDH